MLSTWTVYVTGRRVRKTAESRSAPAYTLDAGPRRCWGLYVAAKVAARGNDCLLEWAGLDFRQIGYVPMQTRRTFLGSEGAAEACGVAGRPNLLSTPRATSMAANETTTAERSSAESAAVPDRSEKVL